jgi:ABC-type uncharacterized transport system substrate-binding protein
LKQIVPALVRVALIYNPDNPNSVVYRRMSEAASVPLAIEPIDRPIHGLADIDRVVTNLVDRGNSGIFFLPDSTIDALRDEVVAPVARRRVPAIYSEPFFVKLGGLAFYGSDRMEGFRADRPAMWIASCAARNPAICRSSSPPNTSSCSTARPPKRSASNCRRRCWRSPTR